MFNVGDIVVIKKPGEMDDKYYLWGPRDKYIDHVTVVTGITHAGNIAVDGCEGLLFAPSWLRLACDAEDEEFDTDISGLI